MLRVDSDIVYNLLPAYLVDPAALVQVAQAQFLVMILEKLMNIL